VGLLAHVRPDRQRLREPLQHLPGGLRQAVFALLGQVQPQPAEGIEPHIGEDQVEHHQRRGQHDAPAVARGARARAPALAIDRQHVEGQEDAGDGQVVDQVAQVDHSALDALEPAARTGRTQNLGQERRNKIGDHRRAGQVEDAAQQHAQDERDELVVGARRNEQADGRVRRRHEDGGQVAAHDRSPVQRAEQRDGDRQEHGQRQRDDHQRHDGQELAQDELHLAHRQGQQHFQGAGALLFAPLPHGERCDQEDHQDRHRAEHGTHVRDAAREKGIDPEHSDQGRGQERADEDQCDRRAEVAGQLLASDGKRLFHGHAPVASWLNTVSSVRTSRRSSRTGQPSARARSYTAGHRSTSSIPMMR